MQINTHHHRCRSFFVPLLLSAFAIHPPRFGLSLALRDDLFMLSGKRDQEGL